MICTSEVAKFLTSCGRGNKSLSCVLSHVLQTTSTKPEMGGLDARRRSPMQLHGCFRTGHPITQDSP